MDEYRNLKKSTKVGLIIMVFMICVGIVNVVLSFLVPVNRNEPNVIRHLISDAIMYAFVVVYAFFGYNKAHGNLLRSIFFVFGGYIIVSSIVGDVDLGAIQRVIYQLASGLATLLVGYIAGRLDRIENNKVLMVIAGALMLVGRVLVFSAHPSNIIRLIGVMEQIIVWAALCLAYTARYEQHKAAGLEDK